MVVEYFNPSYVIVIGVFRLLLVIGVLALFVILKLVVSALTAVKVPKQLLIDATVAVNVLVLPCGTSSLALDKVIVGVYLLIEQSNVTFDEVLSVQT